MPEAQVRIEFRTGIRDKLGYAARWLVQAVQQGARIRVLGDARDLQALSQQLWTANKESFVPHLLCVSAQHEAQGAVSGQAWGRTPVWLGDAKVPAPNPDVLLNLAQNAPVEYESYARIVELVSGDESDAAAARQRWAQYRRQGHAPFHVAPHVTPDRQPAHDGEEPRQD